jgi:threonine dehydratase
VIKLTTGNHAQALALAASTFDIPAHIVMPTISTPSKIAGTQEYTDKVYFSGSTSQEREQVVQEVIEKTGAILVPPYDHPDIMLGQGTAALEMDQQYKKLSDGKHMRAVIAPLGGGGLLSGTTIYFSDKPDTYVFGAEPSFEGGNDGQRGLSADPPKRIESVKTLTIADGLRTPLGVNPWKIFTSGSDEKSKYLEGVYSVTEEQIKDAMCLVLERMKVFVEPSAVVGLAVILYDETFRNWARQRQKEEGVNSWDVGVIFSGGNTTIEAIVGLFGGKNGEAEKRAEAKVGTDGKAIVENVAG